MTQKDFEIIADIIKRLNISDDIREYIIDQFAESLYDTNSRFNKTRFMKASGGK